MNHSQSVIHEYINHPKMHEVLRGKLHGGHFNQIHDRSERHINKAIKHIQLINNDDPSLKSSGGNISMGGVMPMGGSYYMGGALAEHGGNIKNHEELYHLTLMLSPHEVECLREIAVQLLGALPSRMWGKLVSDDEGLESNAEDYDHIVRMPNSHAMARLVDADSSRGATKKGGGFGKALKHVAKIGSKIYKAGHHVLKFANRNKDLLLTIPGMEKYKDEVNAFLDTANNIDEAVNPIVDATIDAIDANATQADKDKLKRMAEDSIKKVVEKQVPNGKEIIRLAEDVRNTIQEAKRPARAG